MDTGKHGRWSLIARQSLVDGRLQGWEQWGASFAPFLPSALFSGAGTRLKFRATGMDAQVQLKS